MSSSSWAWGCRCLGFPLASGSVPPLPRAPGMPSWLWQHPLGCVSGPGLLPPWVWEWSQLPVRFWEGCAGGCARVVLAEQSVVVGAVLPGKGWAADPLTPLPPQGGCRPSCPLQPGRTEQEEVLRLRGDPGLREPPLGSAAAREGKNAQPGLGLESSRGEGEVLPGT